MLIDEDWKQSSNRYKCPYCNKIYVKKGISTHIWRMHGDGKLHNPNKGYVNNTRTAWNKGLDINDSRVAKYGTTNSDNIKKGITKIFFKGKKHTTITKEKISKKLSVNNKGGRCKWYLYIKANNEEFKLQGIWELRFAKVLDIIDSDWIKLKQYNKHSFKWVDDNNKIHTYTPDFYSPKLDKYFEIKGYWWGNDKRKMELVIEQHKAIKFEIVMKKELLQYEKLIG